MKNRLEKEDDGEKSTTSNEDFEIIGGQAQISEYSASDDGESNDSFIDLFKKHIVKRRVPSSIDHNEAQNKDDCLSMSWKVLFIITLGIISFQLQLILKRPEVFDETITRQQQIIDRLENQLKSCAPIDVYSLPVRIEEERVTAFDRKDGFNYFFVIVDWKKNDQGMARQHLHLAFKQSNSSIYIYDHGPLSGRYFTVGDRIIDIDGITFVRAADLRDRILWSHYNRDYFTSIIERPATEQAVHTVSTLLQPSLSSFSVVLSA
ncbi:hypothetical protein WUBG_06204 [Wuchereria bancrofti]|nr:hypothetical protein WUBG_06204 [Wuchereria bancrofti]